MTLMLRRDSYTNYVAYILCIMTYYRFKNLLSISLNFFEKLLLVRLILFQKLHLYCIKPPIRKDKYSKLNKFSMWLTKYLTLNTRQLFSNVLKYSKIFNRIWYIKSGWQKSTKNENFFGHPKY